MVAAASPAVALAAPACAPSQLHVSLAYDGAAAGTAYYRIVFRNAGRTACGLVGYPGVSAVSASGHQVGSPAARDHASNLHPHLRVTIMPGGAAHALVGIADFQNYSRAACRPVRVSRLRIYPPNWFAARYVVYPGQAEACAATRFPGGGTSTMTVRPVVAGA
jgi:hypothetical protein